ncbi:MAG: ferredoxin--NADP reductase [Pseudomonadota bacterium]
MSLPDTAATPDGATDDVLFAGQPAGFPVPSGVFAEKVTEVQHYTDRLFRFRITRPGTFRFRSGEFVMIGLPNAEKPVYRAYSIASPSWDEELEFFSIKVQDGPLTEHLQKIVVGDTVLMKKKPVGTLVNDALIPGKRLYLFATGTGIAPFASIIRDPETYEKFEQVVLCHTTRLEAELAYGYELVEAVKEDPLVGEEASVKLVHYATTTRDETARMGRITDNIESGKMFEDLGVPPLDPAVDRGMICGSMALLKDLKAILEARGFTEGANSKPAEFVVERAFVD